jgi:hypothetical protein
MTVDGPEKGTLHLSILRSPLLGFYDLRSGSKNPGSEKARERTPELVMNLAESYRAWYSSDYIAYSMTGGDHGHDHSDLMDSHVVCRTIMIHPGCGPYH